MKDGRKIYLLYFVIKSIGKKMKNLLIGEKELKEKFKYPKGFLKEFLL